MKIKEQTRKLAAAVLEYGKATLTRFEFDFRRVSIVESAPYSSQTRRNFDMIVGNKEKNTMISEYQK